MNEKEIAKVLIAAFSEYGAGGGQMKDPVAELLRRFPAASQAACAFVERLRPWLMSAYQEGCERHKK